MIADEPAPAQIEAMIVPRAENHLGPRLPAGAGAGKVCTGVDAVESRSLLRQHRLHPGVDGIQRLLAHEALSHPLLAGHQDELEARFFAPGQRPGDARAEMKILRAQHIAGPGRHVHHAVAVEEKGGMRRFRGSH